VTVPTEGVPTVPELTVLTGMSGAGRSTAARVLEDLGWFVVDNLPHATFEGKDALTGSCRRRCGHLLPLFDEAVPLAAVGAPAEPLGALEAAGLALEHGANGLAHGRNRISATGEYCSKIGRVRSVVSSRATRGSRSA